MQTSGTDGRKKDRSRWLDPVPARRCRDIYRKTSKNDLRPICSKDRSIGWHASFSLAALLSMRRAFESRDR
jgi:hypothetical protein